MKNINYNIGIPAHVSSWTDEYFHKSAFDIPIKYPGKKIINFLSQFKKDHSVKLYRGVNKYNKGDKLITSWTYDKKTAGSYIRDGGRIVKKRFAPADILLDTTILNAKQKQLLGYDYKVDDKEVLAIGMK